ncbi:MAG: TonB-dependent receptor [Parabacteroides sp.]|nr:TonB-dependent receptor [Parabacteroides sp.]
MKIYLIKNRWRINYLKRLFFLFVTFFFFQTQISQAQQVSLSNTRLTLRTAFTEIERQTDMSVDYNREIIDVNKIISIPRKEGELSDIMTVLLQGTEYTYTIRENHIVITKAPVIAQQQNKKNVNGTITDINGEPIIGANIVEKGTTNGTVTDIDGNFLLSVANNAVLHISYIGYLAQEVITTGRNTVNVVLQEDTKALEEIVVVGYGVQKKVNLTGAIGTVKTDEALKARPVTNVQELLSSSVPGLFISKGSGAVGSGASINIRGTSTIGATSSALILIDGIPGNIYTLNPNDIESISVLKDAASASIYGSRAANGVILITTKMAKTSDRPVVELSTNVGIQNPQFKLDFVGAEDYMRLYDQAMMNDGKNAFFGEQGIQDLKNGKYPDNKWYKEIYRKNTVINNVHLALSGAEKSIIYRVSVSNDYQQGNLPNNNYNRLIFKPDLQFQLLKNLKARTNMQYTQTNIEKPGEDMNTWQSQTSRISPITPIKEKNGLYGVGSSMAGNPIAGVHEAGYGRERHKEMLAIFDVTYTPVENWNINGNVASYSSDVRYKDRTKTYHLYDTEGNVAKTENLVPTLKETSTYNYRTQLQFLSDYGFSISSNHNFKILAGYSQEYVKSEGFWASRDNMPFDNIDVLEVGSTNLQNGSHAYDVAIQSIFGRLNYDYDGKYLFEANLRTDGSSRFAKGYRWGIFPSFSAGWNIHRESFLEESTWLSEFKIRASWGTLGDAEKVGHYATAQVLNYNPKIYSFNNVLVGGAFNNQAINKNITWEVSELANIGLDFGMYDQKVKFSFDYFNNLRKDILYQAPVPTEFGLAAPYSNLLKMRNKGMEFLVMYDDYSGDWNWGIDMNASFSKNKVLEMGDSDRWIENNTITYLNDRYQLAYGYEADGLFQSQEDIDKHARQGNVMPGNIKFKDQNGDNIIDGDDRVVLNRKVPINFGINLRFGYKKIDFSMNTYGRLNVMRYISGYEGWAFYLSQNARPMHLDSWSETNKDASYPRLTLTNTSNDTQYNSYWLRNSNYLKIQNVQVGYTVPGDILKKVNIQYLRFYLTGQNIATLTGYDGFDPEGGWYPLPRTFAFGFNFKF